MDFNAQHTLYFSNFSIGFINKDITSRFFLIGAICYLYNIAKTKKLDITYLQIIQKVSSGLNLPEDFLISLALMCENFAYGCTEFPTFGVEKKDLIPKIREILESFIPF